ncbi:MAG: type II toxin-antitoxin system VapC family toxin [Firmicutes bacterium]|jgi:predicted nucleic acid-binding protein|nr:type II toxin-antitoxin system VapC family toxin [Bacillota bacterium]MCL5992862.1 type II toxin-antitoxin system VapC family toxin [Bacillota bacterium]
MICYFDTSALVKLYVEEEGSELVADYSRKGLFIATSRVAYAEARSVFARASREGILDVQAYRDVVANFNEEWPSYFALEVSDTVLQRVDTLVDKYPLRGFDALHLASTIILSRQLDGEDLLVACWDARLWDYYLQEGFSLIPGDRPAK